ncbi:MAG TPA: MGMT family protein [Steroidobacteraceae bacterium]|nr:MGMT family protein [Steroidobacteraceae bacterium]
MVVDRSRQRQAGQPTRRQARCEAIWRAVAAIPRGSVATYGGIAASAGYPRAARLVGYALKTAPDALKLPWHRVVAAGGRIVFAQGSRLHREQRRRLESEGITVRRGRVAVARVEDLDALLWGSDG